MSQRLTPEDLGSPNLKVAGLHLWVHGRQFPDADDYWDGNWLRITAYCGASGAQVLIQGAIVTIQDIAGFGDQCDAMLRGTATSVLLDPFEPELRVSLEAVGGLGHIRVAVDITPDHLAQSHRMEFEIDQSYLPGIIEQCSAINRAYPVRGQPDRQSV